MDFIYAQLDPNNIVISVSMLSGEVIKPNMIRIETYDDTILGKKYENGVFVEVPQE